MPSKSPKEQLQLEFGFGQALAPGGPDPITLCEYATAPSPTRASTHNAGNDEPAVEICTGVFIQWYSIGLNRKGLQGCGWGAWEVQLGSAVGKVNKAVGNPPTFLDFAGKPFKCE